MFLHHDKRSRANVSLKAWVKAHEGDKPIHRLLIANNGLAAVKCICSIREWYTFFSRFLF